MPCTKTEHSPVSLSILTSQATLCDSVVAADKSPVPIPNERTWDIDIVRKMCEAEREAIDKYAYWLQGLPLVLVVSTLQTS